jgi:hypothetical protein
MMRFTTMLAILPILTLVSGCAALPWNAGPAARTTAPAVKSDGGSDRAPAPQAVSEPLQVWEITPADKTLKTTVGRWAKAAGWQLSWELPADYAIETHAAVSGTFDAAVTAVATSMANAEVPMKVVFYKGNKVLRIIAKGTK